MNKLPIIFILIVLVSSCCDEPSTMIEPTEQEEVQPVENEVFNLQWESPYGGNIEVQVSDNLIIYNDWVITTTDLNEISRFLAYNKFTGEQVWELIYPEANLSSTTSLYVHENILTASTSSRIAGIDLEVQDFAWTINLQDEEYFLNPSTLAANNKLYIPGIYRLHEDDTESALFEVDVFTGNYEILYNLPADETGSYGFSPPVYLNDEINQREILIFNEYEKSDGSPEESEQNIISFDLDTKEVLWRTSNFTENFASNTLHPPILYEDLVITGGDWSMYAFDIHTGEQVWRRPFEQYTTAIWGKTNHLIHEDRLYVNNSQWDVTCLNARTGEIIWNNDTAGPNSTDNSFYYEKVDYLVFTSWGLGSIMVLDGLDGQTVHRQFEHKNSTYTTDAVYDSETDSFFAGTFRHLDLW